MVPGEQDPRPPLVYLNDILVEIDFLKSTTAGFTLEQYIQAGEKRRAVERSLEIISEASRGIPEADTAQHPEIPWRRIQDLGNAIRHAYFGIMHDRLWAIVRNDLDALEDVIRLIKSRYEQSSH
jgi:uncharacterized protein with HEPN domain